MKIFIKVLIIIFLLFSATLLSHDVRDAVLGEEESEVLFVGDMMFDRTIREIGEKDGYDKIFSCINTELQKYDAVFGNLEGPITSNASVSLNTIPGDLSNMTFTFSPQIANLLQKNNFKAVSLANNHMFDFGRSGVEETRNALKSSNVGWFGDPIDLNRKTFIYDPTSHKLRGTQVALVGFNQFLGVDSVEQTVNEIKRLKIENSQNNKSVKIIVFAHWGEEYMGANYYQKLQAHQFVDAGADLVIGAHPHVIQEVETYNGKQIYYSLGNFIFDQWWTESVRRGMGVEVTLKGDTFSTSPIYFESSRDGRTCKI